MEVYDVPQASPALQTMSVLVRDLFPEDSVYRFTGNVLFDQFRDEDFANLYPLDGQPTLLPRAA